MRYLSLIAFVCVIAVQTSIASADLIVDGDAQADLTSAGAIRDFTINGTVKPVGSLNHFLSINGSEPLGFQTRDGFTITGPNVNGNQGVVDYVYNDGNADILGVRVGVGLTNPTDGDSYAQVSFSVTFQNLSNSVVDLRYIPLVDLDGPDSTNDTAELIGDTIVQRTANSTDNWLVEFASAQSFDGWEITEQSDLLLRLITSSSPVTLANGTNGLVGDLESAFMYDRSLAVGEEALIGFSISTVPAAAVPEASSLGFLVLLIAASTVFYLHRTKRWTATKRGV